MLGVLGCFGVLLLLLGVCYLPIYIYKKSKTCAGSLCGGWGGGGGVCAVCVVVPSGGGGGDVDEPLCFCFFFVFFVYKIYIQ